MDDVLHFINQSVQTRHVLLSIVSDKEEQNKMDHVSQNYEYLKIGLKLIIYWFPSMFD